MKGKYRIAGLKWLERGTSILKTVLKNRYVKSVEFSERGF